MTRWVISVAFLIFYIILISLIGEQQSMQDLGSLQWKY